MMTSNDVMVVTSSADAMGGWIGRLPRKLVEHAKANGRDLVGPHGLLADLTKQILETGLDVEMEEHLGFPTPAAEVVIVTTLGTGHLLRR